MFGASVAQNQQQAGSLFGTRPQQGGGGLFGSSQQPQQNTGGGLFGGSTQQNQQSQQSQQNQQNQSGGLFGSSQQSQQASLFGGKEQSQNPSGGGLFGNIQNNQQQQQQQQPPQQGLFGGSSQNGSFAQSTQQKLPTLGQSTAMWQPNSGLNPREKSVPEQIAAVVEKWDTASPHCAFQYYFYNKVEENMVPYYRPGPNEDPKAWEEALLKKPAPGFIPVLCTGFLQLGDRIKNQQRNLGQYNSRLHEINNALTAMLQIHETKTSIRAMDAKRKHAVLRQRCLTLATKVQVLRNRGYALGGDEEDLRTKLQSLEKGVYDPGLGARGEEVWARMVTVQERAKILQAEVGKNITESPDLLDETLSRKAKKILEDYDRQLRHLQKEMDSIGKDYKEWEKDQS